MLMIVSVLLIAGHIFAEARAISEFSVRYHELLPKEISADDRSCISYDDGLLISMAFASADTYVTMAEYLRSENNKSGFCR